MKGFETKLAETGCAGFVTKPIDVDEMLEKLAAVLGGRREAASLKNAELGPLASDEPLPTIEKPMLKSRLHDHPKLRVVAQTFADQLPERRAAIENAWAQRDLQALAALAHWLKGSGGTAGFDEFTAPARALEQLVRDGELQALERAVTELLDMTDRVVRPEDPAEAASA